jgi:hypothetical protein
MGGPNREFQKLARMSNPELTSTLQSCHIVEIIRFAMYLAVPTASILYFGDPEWYDRYVVPVSQSSFLGFQVSDAYIFMTCSMDERYGLTMKRHM